MSADMGIELSLARTAGLTVLAEGHWPLDGDTEPPPLTGFVASPFGPLVAAAADRCLGARFGEPPAPAEQAERTAMVLVSRLGDMATEAEVTGSVDNGTRASPLLFFQSVPSAVLGVVSAQWGLGGPVICTSPQGDALADGMDLTRLLLADGSADLVLVVTVELAVDGLGEDRAHALLLGSGGA
jgi:hypothetical protein